MKGHNPDEVVVMRGGRRQESATQTGKKNDTRWLVVDRMPLYKYFQPLYFSDKETSASVLQETGVTVWEGYSTGLQRTACRICPGQKPISYAAIRANYPDVWAELMALEQRFGPGGWRPALETLARSSFIELADRGQQAFEEGRYLKPAELIR